MRKGSETSIPHVETRFQFGKERLCFLTPRPCFELQLRSNGIYIAHAIYCHETGCGSCFCFHLFDLPLLCFLSFKEPWRSSFLLPPPSSAKRTSLEQVSSRSPRPLRNKHNRILEAKYYPCRCFDRWDTCVRKGSEASIPHVETRFQFGGLEANRQEETNVHEEHV